MKSTRIWLAASVAVSAFAATAAGMATVIPSFQAIPSLPGVQSQYAQAISGDGTTVVGFAPVDNRNSKAFRWTAATGTVDIGDLAGGLPDAAAGGVSFNGSVVVGRSSSATSFANNSFYDEPFRWTSSGMTGLGLGFGTYGDSSDTSADGSVVVGQLSDQAFRWTQATGYVALGQLPGSHPPNSSANAVSANGTVVTGYAWGTTGRLAYRWTAATGMQSIGVVAPGRPGDEYSEGLGISADGTTIVGASYIGPNIGAFRWTAAGGMQGLGDFPGGTVSQAFAVSGDGSIVVGQGDSSNGSSAFIWDTTHGFRRLQDILDQDGLGQALSGWYLVRATGISNDGQTITGWGNGPNGTAAWVVTLPVPEPSTFALGIVGLATGTAVAIRRLERGRRR
ncbi:MAG TPA: hypothetical protein VKB78_04650 [Pirellulales bacterium]|nr:hypothetical protein [Pirellulales bacterium]